MAWRIELDDGARRDLHKLDHQAARRITRFLRDRLTTLDDPRAIGAPLHAGRALWRYRVGDYRIVARIHDDVLQVLVVRVRHRRHAYWRLPRT